MNLMAAAVPEFLASLASALVLAMTRRAVRAVRRTRAARTQQDGPQPHRPPCGHRSVPTAEVDHADADLPVGSRTTWREPGPLTCGSPRPPCSGSRMSSQPFWRIWGVPPRRAANDLRFARSSEKSPPRSPHPADARQVGRDPTLPVTAGTSTPTRPR